MFHKYIQNVQMPFVKNIFTKYSVDIYNNILSIYCMIIILIFKMNNRYVQLIYIFI